MLLEYKQTRIDTPVHKPKGLYVHNAEFVQLACFQLNLLFYAKILNIATNPCKKKGICPLSPKIAKC